VAKTDVPWAKPWRQTIGVFLASAPAAVAVTMWMYSSAPVVTVEGSKVVGSAGCGKPLSCCQPRHHSKALV